MPNITTTWTPASGAISQTIESYNKAPTVSTWSSTGFTPSNPLSPLISSAVKNIPANCVHRFRVKNVCINGDIQTSEISEGIVFGCVPINLYALLGNSSFTIRANFGGSHSIKKMKFLIYDSTGTSLLDSSPDITIGPGTTLVDYTVNLPVGTVYQVSQILYADITNDGITTEVFSDLIETCKTEIDTTYTPAPETVYAKISYEEAPEGLCIEDADFVDMHNSKAYIRTYSDAACTIPVNAPIGSVVSFKVKSYYSKCIEGCPQEILIYELEDYTLTLDTTNVKTLVPDSYKLDGGISLWKDWQYCYKDLSAIPPCTGTYPPGTFICAVSLKEKEQSINSLTSIGSFTLTIV